MSVSSPNPNVAISPSFLLEARKEQMDKEISNWIVWINGKLKSEPCDDWGSYHFQLRHSGMNQHIGRSRWQPQIMDAIRTQFSEVGWKVSVELITTYLQKGFIGSKRVPLSDPDWHYLDIHISLKSSTTNQPSS